MPPGGLKAIFEHIGGVPPRIRLDNATISISCIFKGGGRSFTKSFLFFKEHYCFEAGSCTPGFGYEQGSVENKVGCDRPNMLVLVPEFKELKAYDQQLVERRDDDQQRELYRKERSIRELFEEDHQPLAPLPDVPFEVCRYDSARTDVCGKFTLKRRQCIYSSAPHYANGHVKVELTAHKEVALDDSLREIARHRRRYPQTTVHADSIDL